MIKFIDKDTWIIKTREFIPYSEKWLYSNNSSEKFDKTLSWTEDDQPKDNFDEITGKIKQKLT